METMEANGRHHKETEKLLTIMMNSYPRFFKEFDSDNIQVQINLWQRSLADCEYRDVVNAFEIWLDTEKYPPTLAEFKPVVIRFRNPNALFRPKEPGRLSQSQFGAMVRTIRNGLSKPFRNLLKGPLGTSEDGKKFVKRN